jgi:hypothetical protein
MELLIDTIRPLHAQLLYDVLSHLDLERDAATIFVARRQRCPWSEALKGAYLATPGRLTVQVLPLLVRDLDAMRAALHERRISSLQDEAGQRLSKGLLDALEAELPRVRQRWLQSAEEARARTERLKGWMEPLLERLREELYQGLASTPPPLTLVDCDALSHARGSHGRGLCLERGHFIACSLAAPREQLLCQVIHEQSHAVTDGPIRAEDDGDSQDTRAGSAGYALHRQLEQAAVELGQRVLEDVAPELLGAYGAWRRRHGV